VNELALFTGTGGGILGGKLLGWRTVCAVEIEPYAAEVLMARQNDGSLEPFPIWDDIKTFEGTPWRGIVDVVSGGFPCQDISSAGKGAGIEGEQSGLWMEMARIVGEVRPEYAFVENSPRLTARGLGRVLGDLSQMGFDAEWGVVGAEDAIWFAGHPAVDHERKRIWILGKNANPDGARRETLGVCEQGEPQISGTCLRGPSVAHTTRILKGWEEQWAQRERTRESGQPVAGPATPDGNGSRFEEQWGPSGEPSEHAALERGSWWESEPDVGRVAHGVANRVDRLKAIGNGQVPAVAALAFEILRERLEP